MVQGYRQSLIFIAFVGATFALGAAPARAQSVSFAFTFASSGSGPAQLNDPEDIAVAPAGNIVVADTGNNRIAVFDGKGNFLSTFGNSGSGSGQFNSPMGVAADAAGNLYVADT